MTICQCSRYLCTPWFPSVREISTSKLNSGSQLHRSYSQKTFFSFLTTSNYTWLRSAQSSTWFVIFHRKCLPCDNAATILTHVWDFILTTWFGIYFCLSTLSFLDSREGVPLSPTVFNRKIIAILKDETNEFTFSLAVVKEQ